MEWKRPKSYKKVKTVYLCPYCNEDEDIWVNIYDAEVHSWVEHKRFLSALDVSKTYRMMYGVPLPLKKIRI